MSLIRTIRAADSPPELLVYGAIGDDFWGDGITDVMVAAALAELEGEEKITVRIDSPGGDAHQGIAIYNLLVQHPAEVTAFVDGWAASAASVILQAADNRKVAENGAVMIHDAWAITIGNKQDHAKSQEVLANLDSRLALTYAKRSGGEQSAFAGMMSEETWFDGGEAVESGLADEIVEAKSVPESATRMSAVAMRQKFAAHYKNSPKDADTAYRDRMRMRLALAKTRIA